MNVAHCIHGLGLGGAQQVIKLIVARSRSDVVHFVYSCNDGVFRQPIEAAGATVRIIERRLPKVDPIWAIDLARAIRRDRIDVVHTHLFGDSLHGYLAARLAGGIPVVMTLHNSFSAFTAVQRHGYRWLLSRTARNIACSPSARDSFDEALDFGARVETIANGIEPPRQNSREAARLRLSELFGIRDDEIVVANIGRLAAEKGQLDLLSAFGRLPAGAARRTRLLLLGDGPMRPALEQRTNLMGIPDRVSFAGFRSDLDVLMPGIDIVAFSSYFEGLSMALIEAMAAASCIVATEVPGALDAIRHQREGLIVPTHSPAELSAALATVIDDPQKRRELGAAARARFLSDFTAERMARAYEAVYRETAAKHAARTRSEPALLERLRTATGTPTDSKEKLPSSRPPA